MYQEESVCEDGKDLPATVVNMACYSAMQLSAARLNGQIIAAPRTKSHFSAIGSLVKCLWQVMIGNQDSKALWMQIFEKARVLIPALIRVLLADASKQ